MAWGEQEQVTERFEAIRAFLKQTCPHWRMGSSYAGWVAAQMREADRVMPSVVNRLRKQMQQLSGVQPGGWNAFAVDGTQITCPRTIENQGAMGDLGKPDGMPQMSLTAILHLGTNLPWDFRVGPGTDSERAHLRQMLKDLPLLALLLGDAGFIGYDLCREIIEEKKHFLLRVGGNIHLLKGLGYDMDAQDKYVYLWPTEQQRQGLPPIRLRLIVIEDEGKQPVYLVTSVLDPRQLTDEQAATLYRARWGIEVYQPEYTSSAGLYQSAA